MQEETLHINTESSMRQLIHNIVEVYRKHKTSQECKTALTSEFLTLFLKVRVVWMVRVVLVVRVVRGAWVVRVVCNVTLQTRGPD